MKGLIEAGVLGAVAGAALGSGQQGRTAFKRLSFYDPIPLRMPPCESLDAWWMWLGHLRAPRGIGALGQTLAASWSSHRDETAYALANLNAGITGPLSGSFRNPLSSGALGLGRAIFWGLAHHGHPDDAAAWAMADASLDHAGDGAWLPAAAAWMTAQAQPGLLPADLVSAASGLIPLSSRFHRALPLIQAGSDLSNLRANLPAQLEEADDQSALLAYCWMVAGLLHGNGDFGTALLATAGCGGPSVQSSLACGAISALLAGEAPKDWLQPILPTYVSTHALRGLDVPSGIEDFASLISAAQAKLHPVTEPEPAVVEPSEPTVSTEPAEPIEAPVSSLPLVILPSEATIKLLAAEPNSSVQELGSLRLTWQHLDPPSWSPGQAVKLAVLIANVGTEERAVDPILSPPDGWKFASRLAPFRLPAGGSSLFPIVLQAPVEAPMAVQTIRLRIDMLEFKTVLIPSPKWQAVGPFVNHEGTGFDKVYPVESDQRAGQSFMGRSDIVVKWEAMSSLDLEAFFKSGPGAVHLWAKVRLPKTGRHRLLVASSVGAVAWVDGKRILGYHDEHVPVPRLKAPYYGEFDSSGESVILIKVLRNRTPLLPMTVAIFGEDGEVVHPTVWLPMEA